MTDRNRLWSSEDWTEKLKMTLHMNRLVKLLRPSIVPLFLGGRLSMTKRSANQNMNSLEKEILNSKKEQDIRRRFEAKTEASP